MKTKLSMVVASLLLGATLFTGCGSSSSSDSVEKKEVTEVSNKSVLTSYATAAYTEYNAALTDAKALSDAIATFKTTTTQANMDAVKEAWLQSRESYGITEIYRLSNGPIDSEDEGFMQTWGAPEGQLNAWPLDENMIDYTYDDKGTMTSGNIIDGSGSFTPNSEDNSAEAVDITTISSDTLASLNENGGDANVATGYHAIEFLIWGQDQDYTGGTTVHGANEGPLQAGERTVSDYDNGSTEAARRMDYLVAASALIISDLESLVEAWKSGDTTNYRAALLGENSTASNNIETNAALKQIMAGMGLFIKSELANERMAVAIQTPSEEDEHSCFSDNTHRDITLNYQGFKNALVATDMLSYASIETQAKVNALITEIDAGIAIINTAAADAEHFDYQIKEDSSYRQNAYETKNNMRDLGDLMVDVAAAYSISLSADDVTDGEESEVKDI